MAGCADLTIGLVHAGWGASTAVGDVLAALVIGATGYGWSIALRVKGARGLGGARGQVILATAPLIGAAIAWTGSAPSPGCFEPIRVRHLPRRNER